MINWKKRLQIKITNNQNQNLIKIQMNLRDHKQKTKI